MWDISWSGSLLILCHWDVSRFGPEKAYVHFSHAAVDSAHVDFMVQVTKSA